MRETGKKRVAVVSLHGDPLEKLGSIQAGGQNVYVKELAKGLAGLGYEVDVYTRHNNIKKKKEEVFLKNVKVVRLQGGPSKFINKERIYSFIPEMLQDFFSRKPMEYDVIHSNYWLSGKFCLELMKKTRQTKYVQTFHSLGRVRHETLEAYKTQKDEKQMFKTRLLVEKKILDNFDAIVSTSRYEKQDMEKYYGVKRDVVRIIPAGVDTSLFRPLGDKKSEVRKKLTLKKDEKVLLYVGRLEWRKGLGTLMYAMSCLKDKDSGKGVKLVIVGGGRRSEGERKRLEIISKELKISDRVKFVRRMDHIELRKYYSMADITVVPSYYEPFGLVALESMACGTPVIASRVGGLQFSIIEGETGFLCRTRDYVDMCEKLGDLLSNDKLREQMGQNAVKRARELNWMKMAERISEVYGSLIKEK